MLPSGHNNEMEVEEVKSMFKTVGCAVSVLLLAGVCYVLAQDPPHLSSTEWKKAYQDQSVDVGGGGQVTWYIADFSTIKDGTNAGDINLDVTIPSNAIVMQAIVDVITALKPASPTYTNGLSLNTDGDVLALASNVLITTGIKACTPVDTAASAIKMTGIRPVIFNRVGGVVTAGAFRVWFKTYQSR